MFRRISCMKQTHLMFQERRAMLRQTIQRQMVIAQELAQSEGEYSRDTMWAWNVVDELSHKLRLVETSLADMDTDLLMAGEVTPHDSAEL